MNTKEITKEIKRLKNILEDERLKDLEKIIDKLYNHPIAMIDKHYNFLNEIENDLKEYRLKYFIEI